MGTRDWDTGSVTWRDYRLECVPACIYQCHYVRASVLQRVGTYECVHLIMYLCLRVYMILCVAIALGYVSLMCLYASLFGVPRDPLSGARSDPLSGAPSEPPTVFLSMLYCNISMAFQRSNEYNGSNIVR